jgi:hypothetical protein
MLPFGPEVFALPAHVNQVFYCDAKGVTKLEGSFDNPGSGKKDAAQCDGGYNWRLI